MKRYCWLISLFPLLIFLIAQNIYAQNTSIILVEYKLCKEVTNGRPVDITKKFTVDDRVFSWLTIKGASKDDKATWLFQGPKGQEIQKLLALEQSGDQSIYMELDLNQYSNAEVAGRWAVTVLFNGEKALTDDFTVEPLTGLVWWGPIAGAALFMFIGFLILSVIVLLIILLIKRKDIAGRRQ